MEMPSENYFACVKTLRDWQKLKDTGLAYVVEPHFPSTWDEHCTMVAERNRIDIEKAMGDKDG